MQGPTRGARARRQELVTCRYYSKLDFPFSENLAGNQLPAKKPEELFENSRLEQRLHYFEHIAVASLRSQDDKDFKLAVLSSDLMPKPFQRRLSAMCYDVLGRHRVDVMFRGPGSAGAIFRRFVARRASDSANVAQVVLDDDDAVSSNFVGMCRAEAISALRLSTNAERYCFLSFPQGATMVLVSVRGLYESDESVIRRALLKS